MENILDNRRLGSKEVFEIAGSIRHYGLPTLNHRESIDNQRFESFIRYSNKKLTDTLKIRTSNPINNNCNSTISNSHYRHKSIGASYKMNTIISILPQINKSRNKEKLILRKEQSMKEAIKKEKDYYYKLLKSDKLSRCRRSSLFQDENTIKVKSNLQHV